MTPESHELDAAINSQGALLCDKPPGGISLPQTVLSDSSFSDAEACFFHRREWTRTEMPAAVSLEPTTWMIFADSLGLGTQISLQLSGAEHRVILVRPGNSFNRAGNGKYIIRPGHRADYDALLADVGMRVKSPTKIIHLWSVVDDSMQRSVDETLELSFFSPLYLAQAVRKYDLFGVDIAVVSNRLQAVSGESIIQPVRATLFGPTSVIPQEFSGLVFRSIDCDPMGQGTGYVAVQIIAEHSAPFTDPVVAYRSDERWIESLADAGADGNILHQRLKDKGVYLITGGLSDLGLGIAESLARNFRARLVLVDRTPLPPPHRSQEQSQAGETPSPSQRVTKRLLEIKAAGGEIRTVCADVTNEGEMKRVVQQICQEFGQINGVIHTAHVGEEGTFQSKTRETSTGILDLPVKGTLVLDAALRAIPLDFLALFSPVSSLVPSSGKVGQVAASSFFGAFARNRRDTPVFAVDWVRWRESDLQSREFSSRLGPPGADPRCDGHQENDKSSERGAGDAFVQVLSSNAPMIITVSTIDLIKRFRKANVERKASIVTSTENVEAVLQNWWRALLNVEQVNLDDDFFELGGHSLIGVALFSKIKGTYGVNLGLSTLFEARTVRQLAQLINKDNIQNRVRPSPWSPVVPIQPRGKLSPLYVISGIGGNVVKFHRMAFHLGQDQPVYGLLPRGLDGKGSYRTRIEDIATDYVEAIQATQPEGPYHLVGYSFGGIVAFEVAQQILKRGGRVGFLGLFDTIEWQYGEKIDASLRAGQRLDVFREHLKATFGRDGGQYFKSLLTANVIRIKHGLLEALGRPLSSTTQSIEESNTYAAANYRPQIYPGKLTLFRSTERSISDGTDEMLGWGALAAEGVHVQSVPSNHFNMFRAPAVKELAEKLRSCLGRDASGR